MPHEPRHAMRSALALGPDHCPPDLFAGPLDATIRGLKAHANQISHARHVALEESFPRTRELLGMKEFHRAAKTHLAEHDVLRQPQARIGAGFADRLNGTARDLAAVEWAWLEAHGAADALAFDLEAITGLDAERVAATIVSRHPAARWLAIADPAQFCWEGLAMPAAAILVTRPRWEIFVTGIDSPTKQLLDRLARPHSLGDLLEQNSAATTALVTAGALAIHHPETSL